MFSDDVVAAAMIDRLVHQAEVISVKGGSYTLKDRDPGRIRAQATEEHPAEEGQDQMRQAVKIPMPLT